MLSPKKVKWRKQQKGRMRGKADRGGELHFGQFGLQATECGKITARQIEASRVAMTRYVKRGGQIWIRIFPQKPLTKKPAETRMGSGKGNVEDWCAVIKPGRVIFEMDGIPQKEAFEALRLANNKLPLHCKPISKETEVLMKKEKLLTATRKAEAKSGSLVGLKGSVLAAAGPVTVAGVKEKL